MKFSSVARASSIAVAPLAVLVPIAVAMPASASAPAPGPSVPGSPSQQVRGIHGSDDPLSRVVLTHDPQSTCTTQRVSATQIAFDCKHLSIDVMGDSMHVQLPGDGYQVHAKATGRETVFHVRERNSWNILRNDIPYTEDYSGDGTTAADDSSGWCLGIEAAAIEPTTQQVVPVDVRVVVTVK